MTQNINFASGFGGHACNDADVLAAAELVGAVDSGYSWFTAPVDADVRPLRQAIAAFHKAERDEAAVRTAADQARRQARQARPYTTAGDDAGSGGGGMGF